MRGALGIRGKLVAVVAGLVALLGAVALFQLRSTLLRTVGAELDKRSLSLAQDVAVQVGDPVLLRDRLAVGRVLRATMANNPDLRYAFVVDQEGRLIAHTFQNGFPRDLFGIHQGQTANAPTVMLINSDEGLLHDASAPVAGGLAGYARVGLSERELASSLAYLQRMQAVTVAGIGVAAVLLTYLLLTALLSRVRRLMEASRAVGAGDLSVRVNPHPADEIGQLSDAFNRMAEQLTTAHLAVRVKEQARTDLVQRLLTAQEEERRRLSRELHDEIGQALTGLLVGLRLVENDPVENQGRLPYLRDLAARTLESVRHLSRELRPAVLDDMGLVAAIRRHVEDFQQIHGIKTTVQVVGTEERRLPPAVETTLYRVVQEALTNVARHSGASYAGVLLNLNGPTALAIVEDDGQGFDPESRRSGLGLAGMRERTALVGGSITIESRPGGGTTIYVKVPVKGG